MNSFTSHSNEKSFLALILITLSYWFFMLSDGALRMLVLLYFFKLGFSPITLAYLFLLYEFLGMLTNFTAGYLSKNFGIKRILYSGISLQIFALYFLALIPMDWQSSLAIIVIILFQGLSGVAKDLTKVSSKSAIKLMAPISKDASLFRWTAIITGSKNSVKGMGFFLGCFLLVYLDFQNSLLVLGLILTALFVGLIAKMPDIKEEFKSPTKLVKVFSLDPRINLLSTARLFLFGARDVWFVVGLPIYLASALTQNNFFSADTAFLIIGVFMASWIILYGITQSIAPKILSKQMKDNPAGVAQRWVAYLIFLPVLISVASFFNGSEPTIIFTILLIITLLIFGFFFAINSSLHSYLILLFSPKERVNMNVGFYYTANAAGRLIGTFLSGLSYIFGGLTMCMVVSASMLFLAWYFTNKMVRSGNSRNKII